MNSLSEGLVLIDARGAILFFNDAAETILGFDSKVASLAAWSEANSCFHSDGLTQFPVRDLPWAHALAGEMTEEMEILVRNAEKPGGFQILVRAWPLRNEADELGGSIILIRNLSQQKESEQKIQTLTNAVEQTADSILITNTRGAIEYVNPAFELTTGYTREEVLGRNPSLLKSGVHGKDFYRKLWSTISSGNTFRATITDKKKNGDIFFAEQTITPLKDITEQRKQQEQQSQMELARSVQQHFYQFPPPLIPGFEIMGASFPADATGGDYFDFVPLPNEHVGISLGDVSGHGISAALFMVELRAYLRALAWKSPSPGEILSLLNASLVHDMGQLGYATLFFCSLHPESRSLSYASAGHLPGYVISSSGVIKYQLEATDIPIGLFPDHKFGCNEGIQLEPGDLLALITDGITEAERPDQEQFGTERTLEYLQAHRSESAQQIVQGLYDAVRKFSDGMPQSDDITLVICKAI
jgi:sigma-B regulation protein RsbU (phosphoserine phosphatase)